MHRIGICRPQRDRPSCAASKGSGNDLRRSQKAATRYLEDPTQFTLPFSDLKPPFVKTVKYRKDQQREDLIKVANSVEEIYTKRFIY